MTCTRKKTDRETLYSAKIRKFEKYGRFKLSLSTITMIKAFMEFQDYLKGKVKHWRTGG